MHSEKLRAHFLADGDGVAAMVFMTMRQRHMGHPFDRLMEGNAGIRKGWIEAQERIDQDARRAHIYAEAGMTKPRNLHRLFLRYA
jgi:hypothetical protein